ncbi:MAG: ABC transporter permease [Eubacteriales bacterium]|nr:ABC transporter permease [Eubacteriales bacterium]
MDTVKRIYNKNREVYRLLLIIVLWMIFMAITKFKKFYSFKNFQTIASQFPEYGLMALGCMLCMMTGGIDLSCVGVANLTSILVVNLLIAQFGAEGSMPLGYTVVLFAVAVVLGAVAGAFNGFLISTVGVPPILATLGVNELLTGISIVLTGGSPVSSFPKEFCELFSTNIGGVVPVRLVMFIVVAIVIWFMLEKTDYGLKIKLLGTNQNVAKFSGLNNVGLLMKTYITAGICSALGGMLMMSNYASVRADYGSQYTMQAILIVVLGGVSPNGGTGKLSGVCTAIVLLKLLESGINRFHNISSYYISLIWGGVLILALVMDYFSNGQHKKV